MTKETNVIELDRKEKMSVDEVIEVLRRDHAREDLQSLLAIGTAKDGGLYIITSGDATPQTIIWYTEILKNWVLRR
jgi:hypothetical protein